MGLIQNILQFLQATDIANSKAAPEGICPNCWGTQEYQGKFYEAIKNE